MSGVPFKNEYYRREVGTDKTCSMCHKATKCCLATVNVDSFLYCCPSHLLDRGFCTLIPEPELDSIKPSEDDIAGVVKEYQEREQKKAKKDDKGDEKESDAKAKEKKPASPSVKSPPPGKTRPQKYTLHREIFQIQVDAYKSQQAKKQAANIPRAPRGNFS